LALYMHYNGMNCLFEYAVVRFFFVIKAYTEMTGEGELK